MTAMEKRITEVRRLRIDAAHELAHDPGAILFEDRDELSARLDRIADILSGAIVPEELADCLTPSPIGPSRWPLPYRRP